MIEDDKNDFTVTDTYVSDTDSTTVREFLSPATIFHIFSIVFVVTYICLCIKYH